MLNPWVGDHWSAFAVLTTSRPIGMGGVGPIPLTEMLAYCELFEIDDLDERDEFVHMIKALDAVYLKYQSDKAAAEATSAKFAGRKVGRGRG